MEQYVDYSAATTVASGGYTAGSGVLNVVTTGSPFPSSGTFSVVIVNQSTGLSRTILRVTAVNSGSQWAVTAESGDANASAGDPVYAVFSALSLDQVRADANQIGPLSGLPSTAHNGDRYWCTDGVYNYVRSGGVWVPEYRGIVCAGAPTTSTFGTAVNTTGNGITTYSWSVQNGALVQQAKGTSGDQLRLQVATIPTAPYTIRIRMIPTLFDDNYPGIGICLYNSGSGKIMALWKGLRSGAARLRCDYWSSASAFGSAVITEANWFLHQDVLTFSFVDDGTNRKSYVYGDNQLPILLDSRSRTDNFTPTHYGVFVASYTTQVSSTILDVSVT